MVLLSTYLTHRYKVGVFPDLMKIAIVSPVFRTVGTVDIGNYRPFPVLPCFSKILERVMCNRLYKYLTDQKILQPQQFSFRKGHSTEHAIAQPVDQNYESFVVLLSTYLTHRYKVGVFPDLIDCIKGV